MSRSKKITKNLMKWQGGLDWTQMFTTAVHVIAASSMKGGVISIVGNKDNSCKTNI